jgi:site-specific DNA-methyltransferase (adenine-specific)
MNLNMQQTLFETIEQEKPDRVCGQVERLVSIPDVHFSSKSNERETPKDLFNKLDAEFNFTLDPCSTNENAKCEKHYTISDNGLEKSWAGETVFMNPPYGREISQWIKKAYKESLNGAIVVCLIPARTDTSYWHDYIFDKAEIRFLRGRVKFQNRMLPSLREDGSHKTTGAPFPSAVIIFRGKVC